MTCSKCNADVPASSQFCLRCGTPMSDQSSQQQMPFQQAQQQQWPFQQTPQQQMPFQQTPQQQMPFQQAPQQQTPFQQVPFQQQMPFNQSQYIPVADNEVLYQVKPTFVLSYQLVSKVLSSIGSMIFVLIVALFVLSGFFGFSAGAIVVVCLLILAIILAVRLLITKKSFENYQYSFYRTKLIYVDGFMDRIEKEVRYKHIRQTYWTQPFLRRPFKLSCIRIQNDTALGGGITIADLTEGQFHYEQIKNIIDNNPDR